MTGKKNSQRVRTFFFLLVISLVLADGVLFFTLPIDFLYPGSFAQPLQQPKTAGILFGGFNQSFTGIDLETQRRVNHGVTLLQEGNVEKLVVVGGNREKKKRKGSQLMADYLLQSGVPREKILVEKISSDSLSNLKNLDNIVVKEGANSVGLISSPHHLLRIKHILPPHSLQYSYYPYNPTTCSPPLSRKEIWFSAHYNLASYALHVLLPQPLYRKFVTWTRENTGW